MSIVNYAWNKTIKYLLLITMSMLFSSNGYSQVKIYNLIDKTQHADIALSKFGQLNELGPGYHLLNKVFAPVKGSYTVYRFIATYEGISHRTEKK